MRHAKRTDRNHQEVRDGLRNLGYDVLDLSDVGGGVPDLCVRDANHGVPTFLEVKDGKKPPSQRRLTTAEETWNRYCGEITHTVTSLEEAISILTNTLDTQKIPTGATS
jgi:hypothetical protein